MKKEGRSIWLHDGYEKKLLLEKLADQGRVAGLQTYHGGRPTGFEEQRDYLKLL
jgi:hypothetical protein